MHKGDLKFETIHINLNNNIIQHWSRMQVNQTDIWQKVFHHKNSVNS